MASETLEILAKGNLLYLFSIGIYHFLLRKSRYFNLNRAYLLLAPVVSFLLPGLLAAVQQISPVYTVTLPELELFNTLVIEQNSFSWNVLVLKGYFLVVGVLVFRLLIRLYNVIGLIRNENSAVSFTFMGKVVLADSLSTEIRETVQAHEDVHADQLHSVDLVWYELLCSVFWINPAFIYAKQALKQVHEYIADDIARTRVPDYRRSLVAFALGVNELPLVNEFSRNNLKNRMSMMNKGKNKGELVRYLSIIGLVALVTVLVSWISTERAPLEKEQVYKVVEKMPLFPGCDTNGQYEEGIQKCAMEKLVAYMAANVNYPEVAKSNNVGAGRVIVKFVVAADGTIGDVQVVRGVEASLDAEALRVVSEMPTWIPGEQKGEKVKVAMVLPILFLPEG